MNHTNNQPDVAAILDALQRIVNRAAPVGAQDGDFVGFYVLPTGPIHKAIDLLQRYHRDAGTHNVPEAVEQYAIHQQAAIDAAGREARVDEIRRKYSLTVDLLSSRDYKDGFSAALDQIDEADRLRIEQLTQDATPTNKEKKS